MPVFMRLNPIPEYVELWNKHPTMFWRKYWQDKKSGSLPQNFQYKKHSTDHKKKSKKKEVGSQEEEGVDAKVDKKRRKKA